MKTFIVNLIGGPCSGKSTLAKYLAGKLNMLGVSCEYVDEFAKDLVRENRTIALSDQLYILANQNFKIKRAFGKVNVIIIDSPLILSIFYNEILPAEKRYPVENFNRVVLDVFNRYDNLIYFLKRNFPYQTEGRYQTESEANSVSDRIEKLLVDFNLPHEKIVSSEENAQKICDFIVHLLNVYDDKIESKREYERKFLLQDKSKIKDATLKINIKQTYVNIGQSEKRVRAIDECKFYFAEKNGFGNKRDEYEKEISKVTYEYLLNHYKKGETIVKDRYKIEIEGKGIKTCEINQFFKPKKMYMIEVEFDDEKSMHDFQPPSWFGREVSNDYRYTNYYLALH